MLVPGCHFIPVHIVHKSHKTATLPCPSVNKAIGCKPKWLPSNVGHHVVILINSNENVSCQIGDRWLAPMGVHRNDFFFCIGWIVRFSYRHELFQCKDNVHSTVERALTQGDIPVQVRDHRRQTPSSGVSTWMVDHPGTPRALGNTWCTRHMAKPRPQVGRACLSHQQNTPQFTAAKCDWS